MRGKKQQTPTKGVATRAAQKVAANLKRAQAEGGAQKKVADAVQHQIATAAARNAEARDEQDLRDAVFMQRALDLAEVHRGRTAPNPIVGCVIVDAVGNVVAEGAHRGPGTKHGEIDALDKLGGKASGGTLYVNLEPCMHQGRTPPCAPVVAAAKLARVVVGSSDPVAGHGGGIAYLREHGVKVTRSLVDECDHANLPFFRWATARQAAFTLKAACTLDGKIATVGGESKWITGEEARAHGHELRSTHDAIMVGIGTVLADDPQLTARVPGGRDPVRIVVDSKLRTPPTAELLPGKRGPRTIIATTGEASARAEKQLVAAGAEIWRFPAADDGRVSLAPLGERLADEALLGVLVEGGGQLHASLLAARLATDIQLFIAPRIVGGSAPTWVGGAGVSKLAEAWSCRFIGAPRRIGDDVLLRAVVVY